MTESPLPLRVAVAGEALIDLVGLADGHYQPCLGGAVYNLARALACQSVGTLYLNPFSRDRFGRELQAQLLRDGVRLAQAEPVPQATSLALVGLNADGHPDYAFYREGVADRQVSAQGLAQALRPHDSLELVCTGGLALDARDAGIYLPWLQAQRAAGRGVVVDANLRPSVMPDLQAYRQHVLAVLTQAHIVKVSDEDLLHLALPGDTALERAVHLQRQSGCPWLLLTLGAEGACLLTGPGAAWQARETDALTVVDTVGAGDSFLAGLLAALLQRLPSPLEASNWADRLQRLSGDDAQALLGHALACASLCVQQRGCVPPHWAEAQAWRAQHSLQSRALALPH